MPKRKRNDTPWDGSARLTRSNEVNFLVWFYYNLFIYFLKEGTSIELRAGNEENISASAKRSKVYNVSEVCDKMGLAENIKTLSHTYYDKIKGNRYIPNKNKTNRTIGAAIYMACRSNDLLLSLDTIELHCGASVAEMFHALHVTNSANQFGLASKLNEDIKFKIKAFANRLGLEVWYYIFIYLLIYFSKRS